MTGRPKLAARLALAAGAALLAVGVLAGAVLAGPTPAAAGQPAGQGEPTAVAGARWGPAQLGPVAYAAGFRAAGLATAIAVAQAESGGQPAAVNHNTNGTVDRGLWQINSIHSQYSETCTFDPACNAAAAYAISDSGTNWHPWVTWQHGAELAFLPAAAAWTAAHPAG